MARPKTNHEEKKQRILEAAQLTFATHGYEGTTNKLIAQEAGDISPALIYHYFPEGKQQLFQAVISQFPPLLLLAEAVQQNQEAPLEDFLRSIGRAYLTVIRDPMAQRLMRILFIETPRQPEIIQIMLPQIGPRLLLPLVNYLQKQAKLGIIKPLPPMAGPLQLFGPLLTRLLVVSAIGELPAPIPIVSEDEMLEILIQTFLYGVLQPTETKA
jgi:AcrR family transcriptional regulator